MEVLKSLFARVCQGAQGSGGAKINRASKVSDEKAAQVATQLFSETSKKPDAAQIFLFLRKVS
jgi:hypothetical protein